MNGDFLPMLACKVEDKDLPRLKFPLLGTPKLDGIRCEKRNGQALTRSLKPVPNRYVREIVEREFPDGVDGELMLLDARGERLSYNEINSIVMSEDAELSVSSFQFWVFDYVRNERYDTPYECRMVDLRALPSNRYMTRVLPTVINDVTALLAYEESMTQEGYEGICLRDPRGPYEFGRSTLREQWLLKKKRFLDGEATILGFEEKMHNANAQERSETGHAKRSSHKAGMVPAGTLGALRVRDVRTGVEFAVGSGFDDATRKWIWERRAELLGSMIKYRYQPFGVKDLPRFPTFLGFRDERDMS